MLSDRAYQEGRAEGRVPGLSSITLDEYWRRKSFRVDLLKIGVELKS